MDILFADWLGTPAWFWLAFAGQVGTLALISGGVAWSWWKTRVDREGAERAGACHD
ncbi:hypothetical protein [Novosphingobium sp.]|uniref:hypothetical protein n=1 Tax=Novosphingobium sp. TaxID=1874826 RepID=UPI002B49F74B|nr:hypothetical protein [Novosphingobium sp.]HKR93451.1 hypothetical protein [Novosphingobium sp.]